MSHDPALPPLPPAPRTSGRGRLLMLLSATAALAAIGVTAVALVGTSSSDDEVVVLEVADAVAETPPTTVAPLPIETVPPNTAPPVANESLDLSYGTPIGDQLVSDSSDATVPDDDLSPLADLLGPRYSAIPDELEPRPRPVGIVSDRIDIDSFPVRAVGLESDGQLEVPDETEIGWYQYGATAGRPGATVLAAHVSWNDTTGPFFRLGSKEPGDRVVVTLDDGTTREYEVTERTMYDKDELPRDRIWRNTGPETLVLITCGGDFNPEIRRYRQNIVVYAVPVA